MAIETRRFDLSEYLERDEDIAGYLNAVLREGDAAEFADALGHVAKARGMTEIAQASGMSRQALYKALTSEGNPGLQTLNNVLTALGLRLAVAPRADVAQAAE